MDRIAIVVPFAAEQRDVVARLLEAGPPYDLGEAGIDRHAVYLTAREAVFVFEAADIDWELDDLVHEPHPQIAQALAHWRELVESEPRVARPVFAWERGEAT